MIYKRLEPGRRRCCCWARHLEFLDIEGCLKVLLVNVNDVDEIIPEPGLDSDVPGWGDTVFTVPVRTCNHRNLDSSAECSSFFCCMSWPS